jgi:hypothetical protein
MGTALADSTLPSNSGEAFMRWMLFDYNKDA